MAEILQYIQKKGLFYTLHPITKIFLIIVLGFFAITTTNIPFLLFLIGIIVVLALLSNLIHELLSQLLLILAMSVVLIALMVLTLPSGTTIGFLIPVGIPYIGGSIPITTGALEFGVVLSLRFIILISGFQLFVISTQPRDLVHTLERFRVPVDYTLMFVIALRFIPTLQIEGKRIHDAQLARGYNPGKGLLGKVRSVAPIIIPLVSNALSRANVLGLTIDMRGYRKKRTSTFRERSFNRYDSVTSVIVLIAVLGGITSMIIYGHTL